MITPRQDMITIFAQIRPEQVLRDYRRNKFFSIFGNVTKVAEQYGVKHIVTDEGMEFSAPKSRMQMFAEKLHFANIPYREV